LGSRPKSVNPLATPSLRKISPAWQGNSPLGLNRRFEFRKHRQLFIRPHNERRGYLLMQW
jgi:hypothetical protein